MRRFFAATVSFAALTLLNPIGAWASDAPAVTDNPIGAQYLAEMPGTGNQGVIAQFVAASLPDGSAVSFAVNINGAEFTGGPFLYHIHDKAIPSGGNCTATMAHLDPYARGEDPPCDKDNPSSCQVGDLSGKYGKISGLPGFSANYTDKYVSLNPSNPAYFGDKSIVLHYANKTRIACANFKQVQSNSTTNGTYAGSSGSTTGSVFLPSPTSTQSGRPAGTAGSVPSGGAKSTANGMRVAKEEFLLGPVLVILAIAVL